MTENTRKGARGFILPAGHGPGNPSENTLLSQTAAEMDRAGIRPREIVADGGFLPGPTNDAFSELAATKSGAPAATSQARAAPANAERATARGSRAGSAPQARLRRTPAKRR